jgi:hypothetical protein
MIPVSVRFWKHACLCPMMLSAWGLPVLTRSPSEFGSAPHTRAHTEVVRSKVQTSHVPPSLASPTAIQQSNPALRRLPPAPSGFLVFLSFARAQDDTTDAKEGKAGP